MIDREKVIRGLELCAYDPDPGQELKEIRSCPECPYYRDGCSSQLIRGALALLEEQEPRVITLDEVLNAEDFVWAEIWTPGDRRWCLIYARINKSIYDGILMLHEDSGFRWTRLESNYSMKSGWRCWSARPTEEQRKNTPWEGEDDA